MSEPDIVPPNILICTSYYCTECKVPLEKPLCPKCNAPAQDLSVHVSEVMGSKCRIGG